MNNQLTKEFQHNKKLAKKLNKESPFKKQKIKKNSQIK